MSKDIKEISGMKQHWTPFKMDDFESVFSKRKKVDIEFVPLEKAGGEEKNFYTLGQTEDIEGVSREADKNIKNANENTADLEKEAYDKGFSQGEKDGLELGNKKALKIIENIENLFIEMNQIKKEVIKYHEKEILEMIFSIATKIIHCKLESNDKIIKDTVLEALDLTVEKSKLILKVNPEDLDYVEQLRPEIFDRFNEIKSIMVTPDPSITRGGCFLETPYGDVDARVEARLEKIYQSLEYILHDE